MPGTSLAREITRFVETVMAGLLAKRDVKHANTSGMPTRRRLRDPASSRRAIVRPNVIGGEPVAAAW